MTHANKEALCFSLAELIESRRQWRNRVRLYVSTHPFKPIYKKLLLDAEVALNDALLLTKGCLEAI